ncbi:MAG: bifunctional adenosylcobinamide kinase/adenosylcobinamide-phosphate guanylyltransferase [Rhodospirillales bacterium]|nr:bifunctional adenosylcobinamide kinase/adenosylcobinamide-phosphate guanylyltransferase [Rhodospirillales bacterium]
MSVAVVPDAPARRADPAQGGNPHVCLVLGGARSGKSALAESAIDETGLRKIYLATSESGDGEMSERIRLHRERRGPDWTTIEEPLALAKTLRAEVRADRAVLVDCLTLWLANLMAAERDVAAEGDALADTLLALDGPIVLVSNEVGQGVVPENALARRFRDAAGLLHQKIAVVAGRVVFVTASLPQTLKDTR